MKIVEVSSGNVLRTNDEKTIVKENPIEILSEIKLRTGLEWILDDGIGNSYDCCAIFSRDPSLLQDRVSFSIGGGLYNVLCSISERDPSLKPIEAESESSKREYPLEIADCHVVVHNGEANELQHKRSGKGRAIDQVGALVPVNSQGTVCLEIAIGSDLLSKIEANLEQCFGYTVKHERCLCKRRTRIYWKAWCHWHVDQSTHYEAVNSQRLSKTAFIPKWW